MGAIAICWKVQARGNRTSKKKSRWRLYNPSSNPDGACTIRPRILQVPHLIIYRRSTHKTGDGCMGTIAICWKVQARGNRTSKKKSR